MEPSIEGLKHSAARLLSFLSQKDSSVLSVEERRALLAQVTRFSRKLDDIHAGILTIALLGGTGVGKSTIMNALARSQVATASHKRPHTDKILIYRHKDTELPFDLKASSLPYQEFLHDIPEIKQILVCDLPDFDSLVFEHRRRVEQFLEHVDILVWVVSPEKYADKRFYESLEMAHKAKSNFCFVLNKADLLFDEEAQDKGYRRLSAVVESFSAHLGKVGIEEPLLFAVSALEVLEEPKLSPWNQFPAFRSHLFQRRRMKEVVEIKAANLELELEDILIPIRDSLPRLTEFQEILNSTIEMIRGEKARWVETINSAVNLWLDGEVSDYLLSHLENPDWLTGPGRFVALLLRMQNPLKIRSATISQIPKLPEEVSSAAKHHLEWVGNHLDHKLLHLNLPESFRARLHEVVQLNNRLLDLSSEFTARFHFLTENLRPSPPFTFMITQRLGYGLLLVLFVVAITDQTAWLSLWHSPGIATLLRWLLSSVRVFFSTSGLAALGVYGVLNILLAFRFFRSYKNVLHRYLDETKQSLRASLVSAWDEHLAKLLNDLSELRDEIKRCINSMETLLG